MTKLQIISRLWSHVTDLRMLIREQSKKTLEEIESELDATEYYCRPYADADDIEAYLEGGEDMEDVISRAEHEEFRKSIEAEDHRQNRRIELLEENTKQINALTISVEKLAQSIELMVGGTEATGETSGNPGEQGRGNVAKSNRLCSNSHYRHRAWLG